MSELTQFLDAHGPVLFLAIGFIEFAGLPMASAPLLVAAGGLAAMGVGPSPPLVVALVALGGWLADAGWYTVGRARGNRLVEVACGLTSNRDACIYAVQSRLAQLGAGYIAVSKFIPGAANLTASAAGIARFPARVFLAADAVAVTAWAAAWVGLGIVFGEPVAAAVRVVMDYAGLTVAVVVAGVLLGLVWRVTRVRQHQRAHAAADTEPGEAHVHA
jgi:membrane protein DedA with SNARE-associated domain